MSDRASKEAAAQEIADALSDNPAVLSAGKQGRETLKEFLPWATDEQLGDVWIAVTDILEAAVKLSPVFGGTLEDTIDATIAGGKVTAGYCFAKAFGKIR